MGASQRVNLSNVPTRNRSHHLCTAVCQIGHPGGDSAENRCSVRTPNSALSGVTGCDGEALGCFDRPQSELRALQSATRESCGIKSSNHSEGGLFCICRASSMEDVGFSHDWLFTLTSAVREECELVVAPWMSPKDDTWQSEEVASFAALKSNSGTLA